MTLVKRKMQNKNGVMVVDHQKNYIVITGSSFGGKLLLPNTEENMQRVTILLSAMMVDEVYASKHPDTGREVMYQDNSAYRRVKISSMYINNDEIFDSEEDAKAFWEDAQQGKEVTNETLIDID